VTTLSDDLRTLSAEAFVYFYPLVTMDVTRLQVLNTVPGSKPGCGPPNQFSHMREFPPAEFRAVVRPNFDTLYSSAWLDLTAGPVIVHAPDTADRYYMLPMLDMWSDVFANPGKRTSGIAGHDWVLTGPRYSGEVPAGLSVIAAPTPHVWIIGRTQTNGPADYPGVHNVRDGYAITQLGGQAQYTLDPDYDITTEPLKIVNDMDVFDYFSYAATLLTREPAARDGLFAAGTDCQFGHRSGKVLRRRPIRR
jgi:hypothetical protein